MAKVVILEPEQYSRKALATYGRLGSVSADRLEGAALDEALLDAEVIVIRLGRVPKTLLDRTPQLKVIASPTTALDHIDLTETERRGIRIASLKGRRDITEKIYATSELTIALILALLRHIPAAHAHVVGGGWDRYPFKGQEVSGKTIGIVGCGRLGSRVATILYAMGAHILATDPFQMKESVPSCVRLVPLEELLSLADIVTVHVVLSPETEGMFGAEQFGQMKPGAFFINTSRGQMVQEKPLLEALTSGRLAGAALDVMQGERPDGSHLRNNPLVKYAAAHDNLLLVPHIGGATQESMALTEDAIAEEVVRMLQTS